MGLFDKFKQGLAKTKALLNTDVRDLFKSGEILGEEQLERFHARLISTDMGVVAAQAITDQLRKEHLGRTVDVDALWRTVKETLKGLLVGENDATWNPEDPLSPLNLSSEVSSGCGGAGLHVGGKTNLIAKVAKLMQKNGKSGLLAAGDTFRAAAVEQLTMWSQRLGCEIVTKPDGTDPAAVAHAGCTAALEKGIDCVIIDTAGRLQTQQNLMNELSKIERVIQKVIPDGPHEVLLVLDATTGQNGISQAQKFSDAVQCTGIVLAKLDGTAKGGVVVAIRREMGLPVKYVGVGEQIDDLQLFAPDAFVDALIDS